MLYQDFAPRSGELQAQPWQNTAHDELGSRRRYRARRARIVVPVCVPHRAAGRAVGAKRADRERRGGGRVGRADDAGREDRADDAGRAGCPARYRRHPEVLPRVAPQRRELGPEGRQQRPGMDGHVRPLPGRGAQDPACHPSALRGGRGARTQQRARSRDLPAQHRARLHEKRRPRRSRLAHHRGGGPGDRHQLDVRALRHGAAGRAMGAYLRRVRRITGPGQELRRAGRPRIPGRRPGRRPERPRLCQALRRRRRHHVRDRPAGEAGRPPLAPRPGRHADGRADAARRSPAGLRHGNRGGRRLHHAVLQQLERREVLGQPASS